jgi:hypothetical protein
VPNESERLRVLAAPKRGWYLPRSTSGITIREVTREKTDLSEVELDRLLDARKKTDV